MEKKIIKLISAILFVFGLLFLVFNLTSKYFFKPEEKLVNIDFVEVSPIPIQNQNEEGRNQKESLLESLTAEAVYVLDVPSASTLLAKNENERLFPASTVKILTALTAVKLYGDEDKFIVESGDFENGNKNDLQVGEELTRNDVLKLMLITSDNDAALLLARHHKEAYSGFIREMNIVAKDLHLSDSFFKNPIGFDDYEQLVSAKDLSILARELMKNEFLKTIVGIKETSVYDTSNEIEHKIYTTNEFLAEEFGVVGIKTGTTDLAGQVLVTQLEKLNRKIIIVVMHSQDRFGDTKKIIDWVFENYTWENYTNS